jgi:imidazole glycerol-phosphate synthase subunit HisH
LMTESHEFGRHQGLGLIDGPVVRFDRPIERERALKVPQIGWNRIVSTGQPWTGTLLDGVADRAHMYFVHSYIVQPQDPDVMLSTSCYGQIEFCSSLRRGNIFACQFHPERSGAEGLKVYRNLARLVSAHSEGS